MTRKRTLASRNLPAIGMSYDIHSHILFFNTFSDFRPDLGVGAIKLNDRLGSAKTIKMYIVHRKRFDGGDDFFLFDLNVRAANEHDEQPKDCCF